jgi:hypothetical protein
MVRPHLTHFTANSPTGQISLSSSPLTLFSAPGSIKPRLATIDPTAVGVNIDRRQQIISRTVAMSATDFFSAAFRAGAAIDVCELVD